MSDREDDIDSSPGEMYLPAPSWIRKEAERHGWLKKEAEVQAEIDRLKIENEGLILEVRRLNGEIECLKSKNDQMREVLDYARRACLWANNEAMIVMSIKREIDRFDHETLVRDT